MSWTEDWSEGDRLRLEAHNDRAYRESGIDVDSDPILIALGRFSKAARELSEMVEEFGLDGNHPIGTCGADPFDETYDDLAEMIETWHEKAVERAKKAMRERVAATVPVLTQVSRFRM